MWSVGTELKYIIGMWGVGIELKDSGVRGQTKCGEMCKSKPNAQILHYILLHFIFTLL